MSKEREIALEQALIAVIGAAESKGINTKDLLDHATALILGHSPYRRVDHPYVDMACKEISDAHATALTLKP
ncbi:MULTISPECIES: hypothetical protein [Pseudomonas]|uniref:hypothetical protein n=1 Tax=Pseudomonas TaxID=286 RepID=UPI000BF4223F|nr:MULTISPECIES: hypothetical protein [Pseudomonas]MBC3964315.1 hypothetical protein [Pseudomonas simiae]PFG24580.1 hypothetical protein ATH90_3390 [Pseudomonas lurida]WPN90324.1 hypothetical protein SC319_13695 [Pseudomonas sp. MUP56]WPN95849.1 hypothetical protein SC318_13700 [Pseudomonas sp. MUP55]